MSTHTWKIIDCNGFRCVLELKRSWNTLYKSLDGGATWHKTREAAYSAALRNGMLKTTKEQVAAK